jgi:[ribosomal protein S18]-alanine N-acetyltransferase
MRVRAGSPEDIAAIRRILDLAPEAAQWLPESDEFFVAERNAAVVGFLVWRRTAPDEIEILNLAIDSAHRRLGVAKALLGALPQTAVFLEVRESNSAALAFYRRAGFRELGVRPGYYQNPVEGAIVMRLQS